MATKKSQLEVGKCAADAVDEQLERYRSMRDFEVTAEPSGEEEAKKLRRARVPDCPL